MTPEAKRRFFRASKNPFHPPIHFIVTLRTTIKVGRKRQVLKENFNKSAVQILATCLFVIFFRTENSLAVRWKNIWQGEPQLWSCLSLFGCKSRPPLNSTIDSLTTLKDDMFLLRLDATSGYSKICIRMRERRNLS